MQGERKLLDIIRFSPGGGLGQSVAHGLEVVVTALLFSLLGGAVSDAGALSWLAVLLAALLVGANLLGYAQLASEVSGPKGAYGLVRGRLGGSWPVFFTGWALLLAGLGLCGVLAQGAARHLGLLLDFLPGFSSSVQFLAAGIVALVVLGTGLLSWGGSRRSFTLLLVAGVAGLSLLAGVGVLGPDRAAAGNRAGAAVVGLLVAFVGLEITARHQGESSQKPGHLARALLSAPMFAAIVAGGVAAMTANRIDPQSSMGVDAPLALMGEQVAGLGGRVVVLALGSAAQVLAMLRVLTLVVRHAYVMSSDGFWPAWLLRRARHQRQVPIRLILLVSFLVLPLAWVPAGLLARVSGLLYLVVLVAVNLTVIRRPEDPVVRAGHPRLAFELPFHPWVPSLTVAVDVLVLPLWGIVPFGVACGCLAAGGFIYLFYGRTRHREAQEGVTVFRQSDERPHAGFRVLVPIANPSTAGALLRMSGRIAKAQGGEVLALQVVVVPDTVPLEEARWHARTKRDLFEKALELAAEESTTIQTMVRVTRSVARGIVEAAAEERADIVLIGRGEAAHSRGSLGSIADTVLRDAACPVVVVQKEDLGRVEKILVPTAGGPHSRMAARLASLLATDHGAEVTLLHVRSGPATEAQTEEGRHWISAVVDEFPPDQQPIPKAVEAPSVVDGIAREAEGYDLVLMGVSDESLFDRLVFGDVPLQVAARVPATVLVRGQRPLSGIWVRKLLRSVRMVVPVLDERDQQDVRQNLSKGAKPGTDFFVLIVLSCIIATLGLLLNSGAVVIGAMLVAPLMTPIMAFSLGLVVGELKLVRFAIEAILKGVALALVISAFIGLVSPMRMVTGEILSRTRPNLLDLAVALASGVAGAYALARKDISAALPGVAIAAALMPPLATVGLGLSLGSARVAGGAFLLFATNIAAISLAGGVVFLLMGIRPQVWGPKSRTQLRQRLVASLLVLLAVAIPLGVVMRDIVRDAALDRVGREALTDALEARGDQLVALESRLAEDDLVFVASVRTEQPLTKEVVKGLADLLGAKFGRPVLLDVVVLPVVSSQ